PLFGDLDPFAGVAAVWPATETTAISDTTAVKARRIARNTRKCRLIDRLLSRITAPVRSRRYPLDRHADLDVVADEEAAGLERGVPAQSEILAVESDL